MGSSGGSQVVYYVPETQAGGSGCSSSSGCGSQDGSGGTGASKIITPAIAKSIAGDTARAQEAQSQERQRAFGISSTYNRFKNQGQQSSGNNTLGGS